MADRESSKSPELPLNPLLQLNSRGDLDVADTLDCACDVVHFLSAFHCGNHPHSQSAYADGLVMICDMAHDAIKACSDAVSAKRAA